MVLMKKLKSWCLIVLIVFCDGIYRHEPPESFDLLKHQPNGNQDETNLKTRVKERGAYEELLSAEQSI